MCSGRRNTESGEYDKPGTDRGILFISGGKEKWECFFFSVMEDGGLICFDLESLEGEVM